MEVMRFGKHIGMAVREVPTDYLKWAYDEMSNCPSYVVEELGRRGVMTGSLWLERNKAKQEASSTKMAIKRKAKLDRKRERQAAQSAAQSQQAKEKLAAMQDGIDTVGRDYNRLRTEFDRADGDPNDCPFNTTDYTYTGPSISWVGGQPVIVPSEFPKEVG